MTLPPVQTVTAAELRQIFNDHDFWGQARRGELKQTLLDESHPSPPRATLPDCTRSQIIAYYDRTQVRVAVVHQYLLPDGRLGASGRPDPKRLFFRGILYVLTVQ